MTNEFSDEAKVTVYSRVRYDDSEKHFDHGHGRYKGRGFDPLARRTEMLGFIQLASCFLFAQNLRIHFTMPWGIIMLNAPYLDANSFCSLAWNWC
jgi:hypothetical protein